eukprot:3010917-Rhodomonas_salina.2
MPFDIPDKARSKLVIPQQYDATASFKNLFHVQGTAVELVATTCDCSNASCICRKCRAEQSEQRFVFMDSEPNMVVESAISCGNADVFGGHADGPLCNDGQVMKKPLFWFLVSVHYTLFFLKKFHKCTEVFA